MISEFIGEDGRVPAPPQSRVNELIGDRQLSARSVLASALLGADHARLTVAELVAVASLFGISAGAARTCLWRMVSNGELTADDGSYALAGRLLERRERVDEASRIDAVAAHEWDGTAVGRRSTGAAQGGDGVASRRASRGRVDTPGQP